MMQEVLRIATDYTRLIRKDKLVSLQLPNLEEERVAEEAKKAAKAKSVSSNTGKDGKSVEKSADTLTDDAHLMPKTEPVRSAPPTVDTSR